MNTTAPVRLNVLLLHNALVDLRSKLPVGRTMTGVEESLSLAAAILRHFFSEAWWNRWVMPETAKPNFLRIDESDQTRLDLTALRVIDLAEVLYNLQHVPGFDECIAKMRNGDVEEPTPSSTLVGCFTLTRCRFVMSSLRTSRGSITTWRLNTRTA